MDIETKDFSEAGGVVSRFPTEGWQDAAEKAWGVAKETVTDAGNQLSDLVRQNPLPAMAVGFGIGCFLGIFFGKRGGLYGTAG